MNDKEMQDEVVRLLPARKGHFGLESGHHGELWLDLELLCLHAEPVQRLAALIAERLAAHRVEVVCGPLIEGAFVALMVAAELGVPFAYAERGGDQANADRKADALFPVRYRLPRRLRDVVRGKRVGIVAPVTGTAPRSSPSRPVRCCRCESATR